MKSRVGARTPFHTKAQAHRALTYARSPWITHTRAGVAKT